MNLKKPKFWDYQKPNIISYLLLPITFLIKAVSAFVKMSKPKKFQTRKQLKKTHKKEKDKRAKNKAKKLRAQAKAVKERRAEKETFKLKDEIRRIQNKSLTIRKSKDSE